LDSAGVKEIWYDVKVDIREKTSAGVVIRDTLNLDPNASQASVQGFNLAQNGSFEIDATSDGQPDNWTITPYSGSSIAITESVVRHGTKALEFNAAGASSGGGTATSSKFPVTEGSDVSVSWSFYANNATTTNTFQIKWYDEDDVLQSTSTLTMPSSGSVPTSWTEYKEVVTADSAATQGEIVLVGIASGGSNKTSKAYFDGIQIIQLDDNIVTLARTQTLTSKTLTAPLLTSPTFSGGQIATFNVSLGGTISNGPSGWTVSKGATGIYTLTHGLGITTGGCLIHVFDNSGTGKYLVATRSTETTNALTYILRDIVAGASADAAHVVFFSKGDVGE
jgi:hypothetical protein